MKTFIMKGLSHVLGKETECDFHGQMYANKKKLPSAVQTVHERSITFVRYVS